MNAKINRFKKLNTGQGMVEFALVLPLLLMLSIGIIEVGRLMVIYASVMAASREAARYALASGKAASGVPYYLDIAGIRAAAGRMSMLSGTAAVNVAYDKGPGTTVFTPTGASDISLGDRVMITVLSNYVPFMGFVPLKPFTISAVTTRTIIKEVSIYGNTGSGSGSLSVVITDPTVTTFNAGDAIHFIAVASNFTGTLTWAWSSSLDGNIGSSNPLDISTLTPGTHVIQVIVTDASTSASAIKTITIVGNMAPVVTINSPLSGWTFDEGTYITFSGAASDFEDGNISANLVWTLGDGTVIGNGASFNYALPVGNHSIIATVTDAGGKTGTATTWVTINPKTPPVVTITTPANGTIFSMNASITFSGTALDTKDGIMNDQLVWKLADGTVIGTGATFNTTLPAGNYTVTASATDSDGLTGSASVTFQVKTGNPPVVTLTSPANGASVMQGVSIYFSATASDTEDGNLTSSIKWLSDISGQFGSGGTFYLSTLVPGTHHIKAQVTDTDGMVSFASVTITIIANTPPVVAINTPVNNSNYVAGQAVVFNGTSTDAQDGTLSPTIKWYSTRVYHTDLGGGSVTITYTYQIGTGALITRTNLDIGNHTITAKSFDSGQLMGKSTVATNINPPVCPTASNLRFICKNKPTCDKLVFDFTTTSPNELQVDYIEVNWQGASAEYKVGTISFGGGTPDPISMGSNTGFTPVVLNGNPLWSGSFAQGVGNQYTRQLFITFADKAFPGSGDPGTWNVYVRFKYCSTSQGSTTTPAW
jgi:Flp pilus assembly protein TadG